MSDTTQHEEGRRFFSIVFVHVNERASRHWIPAEQERFYLHATVRRGGKRVKVYPVLPALVGAHDVHHNDLIMFGRMEKLDYEKALRTAYPQTWTFKVRRKR